MEENKNENEGKITPKTAENKIVKTRKPKAIKVPMVIDPIIENEIPEYNGNDIEEELVYEESILDEIAFLIKEDKDKAKKKKKKKKLKEKKKAKKEKAKKKAKKAKKAKKEKAKKKKLKEKAKEKKAKAKSKKAKKSKNKKKKK